MDPRIPDKHEAFALILSEDPLAADRIEWLIDGQVIGTTPPETRRFLWPLQRGTHIAQVRVWSLGSNPAWVTPRVTFLVKENCMTKLVFKKIDKFFSKPLTLNINHFLD
jgi:penicillin-binding protein 1C